jgi:hypothetical protein
MARPPYRKAGGDTGLWLFLVLLGVAGQGVAMVFASAHKHLLPHEAWILPIGVVPFLLMFFVAVAVLRARDRARQRKILARLQVLGFAITPNPSQEQKAAFLAEIAPLQRGLQLYGDANSLRWLAVQDHPAGRTIVFEYQYITGCGKSAQEHNRTVVLGTTTAPTGILVAVRYGWLERRAVRSAELKVPELHDVARKWSLFGDAGLGSRFLTPTVRSELTRSPQGETWYLGNGWIGCGFRHLLDANNMVRFLERTRSVLSQSPVADGSPFRSAETPGSLDS